MTRSDPTSTDPKEPSDHIRAKTLERVGHFLSAPEIPVYADLKGMCERVSDSYRDRVVVELLQNAHDAHDAECGSGRIRVVLDPNDGPFGTLHVANDGNGFSIGNYDALCSPTRTTKSVNEAIGNKGVGFLSAFQVSSYPEIYSRKVGSSGASGFDGFCFRFADDDALAGFLDDHGLGDDTPLVSANMPRLYLACPTTSVPSGVVRLAAEGFATVVRLPLKNEDALRAVTLQIEGLRAEDPPVQLFLTRIAELSIVSGATAPLVLVRHRTAIVKKDRFQLATIACGARTYVVVHRTIPEALVKAVISRDVAAEKLPESWNGWEGDAVVSLAVAADGPPIPGRLYNFLPMGSEASAPLAAHLDAPFFATINRLGLQPGVELNHTLLTTARHLALEGAQQAKEALPLAEAKRVVADLLFWSGPGAAEIRERLIQTDAELVPTIGSRTVPSWAAISKARFWRGDEFLTPAQAARVATFPVIDPDIGPERLQALTRFTRNTALTTCTPEERGMTAEAFAIDLQQKTRSPVHWDRFYASLATIFKDDPASLAGRRLMLTARGDLDIAEGPRERRGRPRRRLRSTFLPPLRGGGAVTLPALPVAVQRRIAYLDPKLLISREGSNAARKFLLASELVREHESREILRLLAGVIADPGTAQDPEATRWSALAAMMRIVAAEDTAAGVVSEVAVLVPTREGWSRADASHFGGGWLGMQGGDLEDLFDQAGGLSEELARLAERILRPPAAWLPAMPHQTEQITFLRKAGVVDILRPVVALTGATIRQIAQMLPIDLSRRAGLPAEQAAAWRALMGSCPELPNPYTVYTAAGVRRIPGQIDAQNFTPDVTRLFARQVIRMLDANPGILTMTVYRPLPQHSSAENRRPWPSPAMAFVKSVAWLPLSSGGFGKLDDSWIPGGETRNTPPHLPVIEYQFRSLLNRCETAAGALRTNGLSEYGTQATAWKFLKIAGDLVEAGVGHADAERLLAAAHAAWQNVALETGIPPGMRLVGRRGGAIAAVGLDVADATSILVADGDDRHKLSAVAKATPSAIVFEPPANRSEQIAAFLEQHLPARVRRASKIPAVYLSQGAVVAPDIADPPIERELGDVIRQIVVLSLRYGNSFYRGDPEEALQRLATLRLRWLPDLSLRIEAHTEPVPMFEERAVLLAGAQHATVLAAAGLRRSGRLLLVAIAEVIGAALGARKMIGEPLLSFVARLGEDPLSSSIEDFARVLDVGVSDIRGVLGASRASIGPLLATIRPFVDLRFGNEAAQRFVPGGGLATEDDVQRAIDGLNPDAHDDSVALVRRCRETADVKAVALATGVDLAALNASLERLGSPYAPIDLTTAHEETLSAFLARQDAVLRESVRAAYRKTFENGADLSAYVTAREAPRPTLPAGYGRTILELTQATLHGWLETWLAQKGAALVERLPSAREGVEAVSEANLKQLRSMVATMRVAILTRTASGDRLREVWATAVSGERALTTAARDGGWIDFVRLGPEAALSWATASGLWPSVWPRSLAADSIGLFPADFDSVKRSDEAALAAATRTARTIPFASGTFIVGVDSMGALADRVAQMAAANGTLMATSPRTLRGDFSTSQGRTGNGGGGGGAGSFTRLSQEERDLIGFFGESIAFEWLKARFGAKRPIGERCWRSNYRRHVFAQEGDDGLGYDFEIRNGATLWYFEVKATSGAEPRPRQTIELGSSEVDRAEFCRSDRRHRYRILYVVNALDPTNARLFVLPNPRSKEGRRFFAEPSGTGVRLVFPLQT